MFVIQAGNALQAVRISYFVNRKRTPGRARSTNASIPQISEADTLHTMRPNIFASWRSEVLPLPIGATATFGEVRGTGSECPRPRYSCDIVDQSIGVVASR